MFGQYIMCAKHRTKRQKKDWRLQNCGIPKNDEGIMDREKIQHKDYGNGNVQRSLIKIIRERQMKFLGHLKNAIEKQGLCGKIEGRRGRGQQRIKYMDNPNKYFTNTFISNTELIRKTKSRKEWRVCSKPET